MPGRSAGLGWCPQASGQRVRDPGAWMPRPLLGEPYLAPSTQISRHWAYRAHCGVGALALLLMRVGSFHVLRRKSRAGAGVSAFGCKADMHEKCLDVGQ